MELVTVGLIQRLQEIRREILKGSSSLYISGLAAGIRQSSRNHTDEDEARAYFEWVQKNVAWEEDTSDHLMEPKEIVGRGRAECENQVILLGSLLRSRRFPLIFKTTATREDLDEMSHIHLLVGVPRRSPLNWIAIDSTIQEPMGTESQHYAAYLEEV